MALLGRCIGVDLGTTSVKVAEISLAPNGVEILKLASAPIDVPPDVSREERRSATINALRQVLKESKISTKEAVFCVPGQAVFVRRFRLPKTTEERLARIIQYEARQQIPYPIEKTMLEYYKLHFRFSDRSIAVIGRIKWVEGRFSRDYR